MASTQHSAMLTHDEQAMTLLVRPTNMWAGQTLYIAANFGLWWLLRPLVPAATMTAWQIIAILSLLSMAGFHVAYSVAQKRGPAAIRTWMRYERFGALGDEILAVASIFLLLPHAGQSEMIFATAFYIGYIPSGILSEPGNVLRLRRSVVVVLGSFALFLLIYGGSSGTILSLVVAGYAAFLLKGINSIHRIVTDALAAREEANMSADALRVVVDEVSAERDAKTRFIAAASHDLGQPLHAARLFSEQLAGDPPPTLRQRAQAGLERALGSAQTMLGYMLYHMQLEADAVAPRLQPVEIRSALQNLVAQYADSAAGAGMEIRAAGREQLVTTDAVLLQRAVGNLIQNGITHSGGSKLLVGCRTQGQTHTVWVIDNGVGVLAHDDGRIFDDYAQGTNSRSITRGGFGLGLASVRRIAQLLGGNIALEKRWAKGAAFCLTLPANVKTA